MSSSLMHNSRFWSIVKALLEAKKKVSINSFMTSLSLTRSEFYNYINFLKTLDCEFEIVNESGVDYFQLINSPQINLTFSLFDYLSFQAHFPYLSKAEAEPFHQYLKNKLQHFEMIYNRFDLWNATQTLEHEQHSKKVESVSLLENIEEAIGKSFGIDCKIENNKKMEIIPRKVVHLEGELCLIGESKIEKCLINISLKDIIELKLIQHSYQPNFSKIEVEDFIASIRAIADNEIRLVLKVYNLEKFEPLPDHQYFGHPCLITNPQGEYIWAASIESSEPIYEWLLNLGSDVEILDPVSFKKDFLNYCEKTLKKIA
jgi:predicted DNA-binding transcriptional regulator YafY